MQTVLIISLVILVVALAALLIRRIAWERRQRDALIQLSPTRITELFEASLQQGSLAEVTRHISQVLADSIGCRALVFLRLSDRRLDIEHTSGGAQGRHGQQSWQIPSLERLEDKLSQTSGAGQVIELKGLLSERLIRFLDDSGCDLYFPVHWGRQVYGLWFVCGNDQLQLPLLRHLVSSLGQSMSALYHLEWYRCQHGKLQDRLTELKQEPRAEVVESTNVSNRLLRLIRHRDSDTLVGHIIDEVGKDIGLDRYSFILSPEPGGAVRVHELGVKNPLKTPRQELVKEVLAQLDPGHVTEVNHLRGDSQAMTNFRAGLEHAGLKFMVALPLTGKQTGILAWDGTQSAPTVLEQLQQHRGAISELMSNAASFEEVLGLSYTDGLTGLSNHRYFVRRLEEEINRARRYNRSVALIIFDLDELKSVNDLHGHQAGDAVLRQMGDVLRASVRSDDVVARYGGDEFCIIMPESDRETCAHFIRRFQRKIASTKFVVCSDSRELTCTVSQGGAVFPENGDDSEQLIYAADMALLEAKNDGRNGYRLA